MPIVVRGDIPPENPDLDPANPGRLVFSAWGDDSRWRPSPGACPLCGAADQTCTTHEEAPTMRQTRIQGTAEVNADPDANLYVCPEDVVEEYMPYGGTSRPSWRLVHRQGEVISRERAIQLGLLAGPPAPMTTLDPQASPARATVVEGAPVTPTQH